MQLGMNMVDDIIVIYHKYQLLEVSRIEIYHLQDQIEILNVI
jgi:hypothetical protein